jgi:UV excision repair protein RAD23
MDMGFPEEEATTALRAAMGNADVAVEFLMNGIPPHALAAAGMGGEQNTSLNESTDSTGGGASGIEQLRAHPQLNELRRVVQSNPAALSQVLEAIGQQNPQLLQLIHANQAEFLAMMNEPITDDPPQQQQQQPLGMPPSHLPSGEPNPMQLIQMIQQLPEEQRAAAAQSLGMTPEQLQAFSQMISQLPPAELQALLGQMGGRGGGAGGPGGPNVIRLSEEEMNSVNRLTELGFDQQDAVQAYLACDKNEALAANMLMDGWNNDDNLGGGGGGGN